jgi:hypothetical protein
MIELGSKARDTVTGFTGIVVASHKYLHGCMRYSLQPPIGKDGKLPDQQTFDEPQLRVISTPKQRARPAGPGPG